MKNLVKWIKNIQLIIGSLSITIFFIAIIVQVFARYTGFTVMWTGEVSRYSFIWFVFMGAGVMSFENRHFAFDSLLLRLPAKKQIIAKLFISLVILIFSVAILYYGIIITNKFWNYQWINLPGIKMGYTWLCVPLLGLANIFYCIGNMYELVKELKAAA